MAKTKNRNVEETAGMLDIMLTEGIKTSTTSNVRRPATIEDIKFYLEKRGFGPAKVKDPATGKMVGGNNIDNFTRSLNVKYGLDQNYLNGFYQNFKTEVEAFTEQFFSDQDYDTLKRNKNLALKLKETEDPVGAMTADIAGTMTSGLPLGGIAMRRLGPKYGPVMAGRLVAGGEGAVYGFGEDGPALNRLFTSVVGGMAGYGSAWMFQKLGDGFMNLKRKVSQQFGLQGTKGQASEEMLADLSSDQSAVTGRRYSTVEEAIQELRDRETMAPNSQPLVADLGDNTKLTASAVAEGLDRDARTKAINVLSDRQKGVRDDTFRRRGGQMDRLKSAVERESGIPKTNLFADIKVLQQVTKDKAGDAYRQAYKQADLDVPEINRYMMLPDYQQAYKEGYELSLIEARFDPNTPVLRTPPEDGILPPPYSIAELDYTSRGKRQNLGIYKKDSGPTETYRANVGDLQSFLKIVDDNAPDFGTARKTYALGKHAEDALEEGKKILSKDPDEIAVRMQEILDEEGQGVLEYFRIGAIGAIYRFMNKNGLGRNIADMIEEYPKYYDVIETVFGNTENMKSLIKNMMVEADASKTRNFMRNSQTPRITERQRQILGQDVQQVKPERGLFGNVYDRISGVNRRESKGKKVGAELADLYFDSNPLTRDAKMRSLYDIAKKRQRNRQMISGGMGLLGGQVGKQLNPADYVQDRFEEYYPSR